MKTQCTITYDRITRDGRCISKEVLENAIKNHKGKINITTDNSDKIIGEVNDFKFKDREIVFHGVINTGKDKK